MDVDAPQTIYRLCRIYIYYIYLHIYIKAGIHLAYRTVAPFLIFDFFLTIYDLRINEQLLPI